MARPTVRSASLERTALLKQAGRAIAAESEGALDALAAFALRAQSEGDSAVAAAAAGLAVLVEHLQSSRYAHAPRMLALLAEAGPMAAEGGDGLLAWAGAAVAHDYGVLPSWPGADVSMLMERAQRAPADVALAVACALGEVCERNGQDAEFAMLQAQMEAVEAQPDASPFWRGHWTIVSAWHLQSFSYVEAAAARLAEAQALAATHGLAGLGAVADLQRARLVEWRRDPAAALALAERAMATADPAGTPLRFADRADVRCRVAMRGSDFHAAVGHARRAAGYLQAAAVWPGFQTTYRVNEAYALLGAGAIDEALTCLRTILETPAPRFIAARVQCLVDLASLIGASRRGEIPAPSRDALAGVIRALRELEWPNVLPLLPQHVAEVFARALEAGVEPEWVRSAIRTRSLAAPPGAPEAWPWTVKLRALGAFEVVAEAGSFGRGIETSRAASKPLELLRLLAGNGLAALRVETVAEALWPGDGREGRQKAFEVTAARLRRLLGADAAIAIHDRRVHLDGRCVWVDVQAFDDRLAACEAAAADSGSAGEALDAALGLYRGPCLADSAAPWAAAPRERLRTRLAAALLRVAGGAGTAPARSRERALRALAADPPIEALLLTPRN
jgi:hypothetical protein